MEHLSSKRKLSIMIAIMAAMLFAAINQTITSTAMPRIIAILDGMDYYTWTINIYLLTSTIATVLVGKLSDMFGRKPFLLAGILLFMVGAFLTGTSSDVYQFIIYRGIQGVGAGIIQSTAFTAVGDLFPPRERGKWMGLMMAVFGFSSVLGPTLGGFLIDNMDWHWLFWIFLPLGVVAFVMILTLFPKGKRGESTSIDYLGSLLMTTTIVPLLLAFTWAGTEYDWGSSQILGLLAGTVVSALLFIFVESKAKNPILPLHLFKNSVVTISNIIGFIMNFGMMGAMIYLSFFVQGVLGISATYAGYVTMPMSIVMVVASALTGQKMAKKGKYKRYALIGIPIMIAGMTIMVFMNNVPMAVLSMIVFGLGLGLGMPVFSLATQNAVSHTELGVVTASSQLFRNLGGTIGIAVMGTVMSNSLTKNLKEALQSSSAPDFTQIDPKLAEQMLSFANPQALMNKPLLEQTQASLPADVQPVFLQMIEGIRDALGQTLSSVFLTGTIVLVVAFVLVFFLKELPLRTSNQMPVPEEAEQDPSNMKSSKLAVDKA
ncbi:MDR family MFS transporter [Paenibacillus sp. FSL R7-0048]|jgi:EmrB/QacA subfamily drug resistance transporter|uniref:MDR family MFS transporter n=1 Tax=Paenibacillus TaxID=44249 RepID=UPI00096F7726|nr:MULTISPECIES: MDR family MFS transporter [Paenibacillus]MDH6427345.1 EmrB/QacA subfamily drug resistance transporter [Paenibacillus sp. PastH-4]MDH6443375.1 EmrB/QacA subfamily drug resistance transporter [Paenibacillus sp. PastF-4]MDH6525921.1 EmrB/QacA subfamily drug resistance transporter [Paenibacillus sp. PastH-3]OMD58832.1 MFS transporter [Paenibacillus odorifer]OMD62346.1 MFS transporter [Paenibacillus odorifer]